MALKDRWVYHQLSTISHYGLQKWINLRNQTQRQLNDDRRYIASSESIFPWYTRYRDLFLSTGGVADHETFDHPMACIIAISSSAPDPINEIHQLNNMSTPA